jgi:uncharacterized membrane protein YfcA
VPAAFFAAILIGLLAGLVGLGGGEFRLPVLVALCGLSARAAVPMNLIVSFITLAVAFAARAGTLTLIPVLAIGDIVAALAIGGAIGAASAARWLARLSDHRLERAIAWLLAGIGALLIGEAFIDASTRLTPIDGAARVVVGLLLGVAIGAVAALLGVAGGELLVPTLLFVFGVDVTTAGTASLLISLVTVTSGLWRYGRLGLLPRRPELMAVALPMGAGSVVGAALGALAVGWVAPAVLKLILGTVLIVAAIKTFWRKRIAATKAPDPLAQEG